MSVAAVSLVISQFSLPIGAQSTHVVGLLYLLLLLFFKKKFRVTYISSINEFERSIEQSTPTSKVNTAIAVAVGNEKGDVTISVHDWQMYFTVNKCAKVPHITKFNHFEFNSNNKGKVLCKNEFNGVEFIHKIFVSGNAPSGFPEVIQPPGLSEARKAYLYKQIRPYVKDEFKDVFCVLHPYSQPMSLMSLSLSL